MGKGVTKAVENVNTIIAPALLGKDPTDQKMIDDLMIQLDGTKNKGKLGANAILAVSMAVSKAGAAEKDIPLYKHISEFRSERTQITDRAGRDNCVASEVDEIIV